MAAFGQLINYRISGPENSQLVNHGVAAFRSDSDSLVRGYQPERVRDSERFGESYVVVYRIQQSRVKQSFTELTSHLLNHRGEVSVLTYCRRQNCQKNNRQTFNTNTVTHFRSLSNFISSKN